MPPLILMKRDWFWSFRKHSFFLPFSSFFFFFLPLPEPFWLKAVGLSDAVEASTLGSLSLYRDTKFIIGFDFAVTLSSPESFCVLFDITSRQLVEMKWLIMNRQKMIPFITCEISLGQYVCELVFGVNVFDLDFGVQIDSFE